MSDFVTKLPDWQARLDLFVATSARRPFVWGDHDCALYAAAACDAQIGIDFAAPFRGRYSSLEEGLKLLQDAGFADHVALAAANLQEIPVAFAQVGDIAAVDLGDIGVGLTVVAGHRLIGPMMTAGGSVPLTSAFRAFSVGWHFA